MSLITIKVELHPLAEKALAAFFQEMADVPNGPSQGVPQAPPQQVPPEQVLPQAGPPQQVPPQQTVPASNVMPAPAGAIADNGDTKPVKMKLPQKREAIMAYIDQIAEINPEAMAVVGDILRKFGYQSVSKIKAAHAGDIMSVLAKFCEDLKTQPESATRYAEVWSQDPGAQQSPQQPVAQQQPLPNAGNIFA